MKCLYDHQLGNKACFSDITVKKHFQSFTHKMASKASWRRNYVTVTLSIKIVHTFSGRSSNNRPLLDHFALSDPSGSARALGLGAGPG